MGAASELHRDLHHAAGRDAVFMLAGNMAIGMWDFEQGRGFPGVLVASQVRICLQGNKLAPKDRG